MQVLVDSSVWIHYFRTGEKTERLDTFIENNQICINNLILTELTPPLRLKRQFKLIYLLQAIERVELVIDWEEIIDYQTLLISNGINRVGIPDLIILQNVIQNDLTLYSFDKHFKLIKKFIQFELIFD